MTIHLTILTGWLKLDQKYELAYFNRAMVKLVLNDKNGACEDFDRSAALGYQPGNEALVHYCQDSHK